MMYFCWISCLSLTPFFLLCVFSPKTSYYCMWTLNSRSELVNTARIRDKDRFVLSLQPSTSQSHTNASSPFTFVFLQGALEYQFLGTVAHSRVTRVASSAIFVLRHTFTQSIPSSEGHFSFRLTFLCSPKKY